MGRNIKPCPEFPPTGACEATVYIQNDFHDTSQVEDPDIQQQRRKKEVFGLTTSVEFSLRVK